LGTVRLLETIPHSDPPTKGELLETQNWVRDFIRAKVSPTLAPSLAQAGGLLPAPQPFALVGTGGTTTILARMEARLESYDRVAIENTRLNLDRVRWHVENLWHLPLARREAIIGLPRKRADVILPGAIIFQAVMKEFGFPELRVTTRGLRFAAVLASGT